MSTYPILSMTGIHVFSPLAWHSLLDNVYLAISLEIHTGEASSLELQFILVLCSLHNPWSKKPKDCHLFCHSSLLSIPQLVHSLTWEKKYEARNEDLRLHHGADLEDKEKTLWLLWPSARCTQAVLYSTVIHTDLSARDPVLLNTLFFPGPSHVQTALSLLVMT